MLLQNRKEFFLKVSFIKVIYLILIIFLFSIKTILVTLHTIIFFNNL